MNHSPEDSQCELPEKTCDIDRLVRHPKLMQRPSNGVMVPALFR